jgi:hypothetical protein
MKNDRKKTPELIVYVKRSWLLMLCSISVAAVLEVSYCWMSGGAIRRGRNGGPVHDAVKLSHLFVHQGASQRFDFIALKWGEG